MRGTFPKAKNKRYISHYATFTLISLTLLLTACGGGGDSPTTQQGNPNSATLTWDAPTTNEDGTPLNDLAGYNIYYGTSSGVYTTTIPTENIITYTVGNLIPGIYYFVVTAVDTSGNESNYSNEVNKAIP